MEINFIFAAMNNDLQKELKFNNDNFSDFCLFGNSQSIISFVDLWRIYQNNDEDINDFFVRLKTHFKHIK